VEGVPSDPGKKRPLSVAALKGQKKTAVGRLADAFTIGESGRAVKVVDIAERDRVPLSGPRGPQAAAPRVPCQYRHNCPTPPIEAAEDDVEALLAKARKVGGSHRKTAYSLRENVGAIVRHAGVQNLVFFTPTLANKDGSPPDPDRAQECWRRMEKVLAQEFPGGGVRILERGGRTLRLHYHVMLDVGVDVRAGYDFESSRLAQASDRRAKWRLHGSANRNLRLVHDRLFAIAKRSGFGVIFHCEPVRSESEAIKTYLAKYICKHVGQRLIADKGRRLVGYFGAGSQRREIPAANRFAFGGALVDVVGGVRRPNWKNGWAWLWRQKVAKYFKKLGIESMDTARELLGPKWAYEHREMIAAVRLEKYPYLFLAVFDRGGSCSPEMELTGPVDLTPGSLPVLVPARAGESQTYVEYRGVQYRSKDVLAAVAARRPKAVPEDVCVVWADGSVTHRELVEASS